MPARCDGSGRAQILDAGVGATADESDIDRQPLQPLARQKIHVVQHPLEGGAGGRIGCRIRRRHAAGDGQNRLRAGAPCHVRRDGRGIDGDRAIKARAWIGGQAAPRGQSRVPRCARGGERTAGEVSERGLVGCDQAGAGAGFDGHVAHRHAAGHVQGAYARAGVFNGVAGGPAGADPADDGQDQILGGDAGAEHALHLDQHGLRRFLQECLRRQHVFHFRRADAEGERAERAMGGGVAVATDDGQARQGNSLLRTNHMHDALTGIADRDVGYREGGGVGLQRGDLQRAFRLLDRLVAGAGGNVVVHHRQRGLGAAHAAAGQAQALESLGAADLVHQMPVDVEQAGAIRQALHHVGVPDFFEHRARHGWTSE